MEKEHLADVLAQHTFFRMKKGFTDLLRCDCGYATTASGQTARKRVEAEHQAQMIDYAIRSTPCQHEYTTIDDGNKHF